MVAGLEASMSKTLGGGYASSSTKAIMDQYTKQMPQAGDSPIVTATFLARIKQELGIVAENFASHPGASEAQIEQVKNYMKTIDQVIPFTVKDVIAVQRADRGTVSQQSAELINIPTKSPLPTAPVPQETGAPKPKLGPAPQDVLDKATEAIKNGANPDEVIKRLRDNGYDVKLEEQKK